jgi:hypothetical protein
LEALTPERVDQAVKDLQPFLNGFSRATERRLSNLVFHGAFRPVPAIGGYATVATNVERIEVEAVNSGVEVRVWDGLSVEAGQTYVRDRQVDGVVTRILWRATQNLSLDLLTRYDIRSTTLLENAVTIRVGTCCWEVGLRYTHRSEVPGRSEENSVQVVVDLKMPTVPAQP